MSRLDDGIASLSDLMGRQVSVRGTFNDDWHYEVSGNYGEFDERNEILGNVNLQRWLLSIDARPSGASAEM